jgi:integrase
VKTARQMFRRAVRWKMLDANPFDDVKAGSQSNKSREHFVSQDDAHKVLDACPDAQWRLLFALSRFGGLRCPSESLSLRWADVRWAADEVDERLVVRSPKTEHLEGRELRPVPLFKELRPYLREAFDQAEPGAEYVISRYRDLRCNLRTQLERIIERAGVKPWPRLWHNLRSTRQTELCERFPDHVVCAWLGNTRAVARSHYLQVTDMHFALAAGGGERVQKTVQEAPEALRMMRTTGSPVTQNPPELPGDLRYPEIVRIARMTPTGFEPVSRP